MINKYIFLLFNYYVYVFVVIIWFDFLFLFIDVDECVSLLCIYGNCIDDVNSFYCLCDVGFSGIICLLS